MAICRKQGFDTPSEAFSRLKEIQLYEEKRAMTPVRYYECEHCEKYHLTHKSRQQYYATREKPRSNYTENKKRRLRAYRDRKNDRFSER